MEIEMKGRFEATEGRPVTGKLRQHMAAIAVSLGALGAGTTLGWMSVATAELSQIPSLDVRWVSGCMSLGALAAAIPIGWLADMLGRKRTGLCLAVPFLVGWACLIWENSALLLYLGRLLTGAAGGSFNVLAPIYIAETAHKEIRGLLCGYFQLLLSVGTLYVYLLGMQPNLVWISVGCALVPVIFLVVFSLVPETPPYLLRKGREDDARAALRWLRGPHCDVEAELADAKAALEEDSRSRGSLWKGLGTAAARRGIITGLGLIACFQLSGINAVLFYAYPIFQWASIQSMDGETSAVVVGAMMVLATLVASLLVDRLGRRPLMVVSSALVALCSALLGLYFLLSSRGQADALWWLPLTSLCLFVVSFSLGLGPVTWVLLGELFAPEVRAFAGSLCCLYSWLLSFLVTTFFNDLKDLCGVHGTFWIFASISAAGAVLMFFMLPETKDRSLEQVQARLSDRILVVQFSSR